MDLGDLGPLQDVGHQDRVPKGGGEEQGGNKRKEVEGDTGILSELGEGGSYLPVLGASSSAGRGESGLLIHKLLISIVKCRCRTLSQAGFMCPGCSNSS